jgi:oxygen-dependent protoporphyrinogen oxidase
MKQVVIVGAGISGLGTAFYIRRLASERGFEVRVTVLEADSRPGGRVWTERIAGFQIEAGANGFLDSKRSTLELCGELGLDGDLIATRPEAQTRYVLWQGQLHALPTGPGQLLRTKLLGPGGKLRLLLEWFVPARRDEADESVHEFACRRIGREGAEILIDALVTGIHAGDPTLLSAPAAFPRMVQLEREYGSLLRAMPKVRRQRAVEATAHQITHHSLPARQDLADSTLATHPVRSPGGTLRSLRGGMGQLIERLVESCDATLLRGADVKRIRTRDGGGWLLRGAGADQWQADAVVLACPSFAQAEIVRELDPELARLIDEIRYNSLAVVALGFHRRDVAHPLEGFGYLSPQRTRRDVLGVLWNSSIFDRRAPDGMVLLEAMCGGWNRPDVVGWDDERLVRAVLQELRETMQIAAAPALVQIVRWPQAIPQYHVGHLARVAAIEARCQRFSGLYLTGNSFRGVSVNDCTEDAKRCAERVVSWLAR